MIRAQRIFSIPAIMQMRFRSPQAAAAAVSWWLSGGISAANAIAVYQAKGAADKATSLTDLAGNGYTLAEAGTVTWASNAGWSGWSNANYLQYIATRFLSGNTAKTVVVRMTPTNYSSLAQNIVCLSDEVAPQYSGWALTPELAARYFGGNNVYANDGANADQVFAVTYPGSSTTASVLGYKNGGLLAESGATAITPSTEGGITVGGLVLGASTASFLGTIAAIACYDTALTAPQVAAVSTAMALL